MNTAKNIAANLCRIIVALTFVLSGYVKAVDPLGTQYKIEDYAAALGAAHLLPGIVTLAASIALSAFEFCLGIMLLLAVKKRLATLLALIFIALMTAVTIWIYAADPVQDCGCFGDAIHLTNGQSLLKNIILLALAAIMYAWHDRMVRFLSDGNSSIAFSYSVLFVIITALYCLYYLPLFDFRPYRVGTNIIEAMTVPAGAAQPEFETTFIMKKNGQTKEFRLEDYPDSSWTFVDSKTSMVKEGFLPAIHDFAIQTADGTDITDSILLTPGYTFLLIAPYLEKADDANFGPIDQIYEYAQDNGYPFLCLTSSGTRAIRRWQDSTGAEYPFFFTDGTTLKTVIRSNPGLILLKDGVIIQKWSHNRLPKEERLNLPLEQLPIGKAGITGTTKKITWLILLFIVPVALLSLADRLWAWRSKLRDIRKTKNSFTLKNKTTMAKKIVAGNWKMNKSLQEGIALAKELAETVTNPNCGVVICTPFIHLASVAKTIEGSCIKLGAQNCADKASGAYTGEVSAEMVKSAGAQYVILGHSERREYYHETPEILKEKVKLALANGLKIIFCIGETLAEREAGKQNDIVKAELEGSVFSLTPDEWKNIVIAYEPIWAIGTGKTATADQAEEIHAYIRACIAKVYGNEIAAETTILYGGSCKASNAPELFAKPDIDGGLIGGASLKAADFKGIIDAWNK
ncbi:MAG: triose-phosphate isomerase [Prevotella sp.]|nr:triose-phosphate isomerase [Prevotella sp.]